MQLEDTVTGAAYVIHPSALPDWADCQRRAAARIFSELIEAAGFELRKPRRHIGASVGQAVHAGAADVLKQKIETGLSGSREHAIEVATAVFDAELEAEMVWDGTTGDRDTGQKQVGRMIGSYTEHLAPAIDPVAVEERLECDVGDGFLISGKKDVLCRTVHGIRDLKTGKKSRANAPQYGSYGLIDRAHERHITSLVEDFLARASLRSPQPKPETIAYPVAPSIYFAWDLIQEIKRAVRVFEDHANSGARPPESAFLPNPQSMLCRDTYCPAWGTKFCRVHAGAK